MLNLNSDAILYEFLAHNLMPGKAHWFDCAKEAIERVNAGEGAAMVKLPKSVFWNHKLEAPAGEIVTYLRLEEFTREGK